MKALSDARSAGISDEQALEMAGLPRNTVLNPIETQENNGQQGNSNY